MGQASRLQFRSRAWMAIGPLIFLKLLLLPLAVLMPEEAYYWMYSQHPAACYLDHPPMIAWMITAGTAVFGHGECGVRIATWLLGVGSTWLCYRVAADWCGRRAGLTAAVIFAIAPLFFGTGFIATPDGPLLFFWLLALLGITRGYQRGGRGWWLLAGIATGLAFTSKYPGVFLPVGALAFLASDRRGRERLQSPGPWLAVLAAVALATPVVYWNATHDWASFRFQSARRIDGQRGFTFHYTLEWLGAQFLLASPLIFALVALAAGIAICRFHRDTRGRWRFAVCFSLPWLAACAWHGLFASVKINWFLPVYCSLLPVAAVLLRWPKLPWASGLGWDRRRELATRYAGALVILNTAFLLYVSLGGHVLPRLPYFAPWDELAEQARLACSEHAARTGAEPFIIGAGRYQLASELSFYLRARAGDVRRDVIPEGLVFAGKSLSYAYWYRAEDFVGRDALFITDEPVRNMELLRKAFASTDEPRPLYAYFAGTFRKKQFLVVRCLQYRGAPQERE